MRNVLNCLLFYFSRLDSGTVEPSDSVRRVGFPLWVQTTKSALTFNYRRYSNSSAGTFCVKDYSAYVTDKTVPNNKSKLLAFATAAQLVPLQKRAEL
jgi:hypothetical protein